MTMLLVPPTPMLLGVKLLVTVAAV
jgi:hypothetical protein